MSEYKEVDFVPTGWRFNWGKQSEQDVNIFASRFGNAAWSPANSRIRLGNAVLFFNYDELIAATLGHEFLIMENDSSSGRGWALNRLDPDKNIRMNRYDLIERVKDFLENELCFL